MEEKTLKEATVTFPVRDGQVLLGMKMRKIGAGCWNGYGGGVEQEDESIEATAIRELEDESKLVASKLQLSKVAVCYFTNMKSDSTTFVSKVHVYLFQVGTEEPVSTDEMTEPTFFPFDKLPLDAMMPADRYWVPRILAGECLIVRASYGPFQKKLLGPVHIRTATQEELI